MREHLTRLVTILTLVPILTLGAGPIIEIIAGSVSWQDGQDGILRVWISKSGPVEIWVQSDSVTVHHEKPVEPTPVPAPPAPPAASQPSNNVCFTLAQVAELGKIKQELLDKGHLAGAVVEFQADWNPPQGWVLQREGQTVSSVKAGEAATVWTPEHCRPWARS